MTGTPVKMDEPVVEYLKVQGYDYETVLPAGKRVFLRTNSNCSTGGESVDMTEIMPTYFKKVAEKASRAFDAKICGVDIIIEDLDEENYSIIEINDNPSIDHGLEDAILGDELYYRLLNNFWRILDIRRF